MLCLRRDAEIIDTAVGINKKIMIIKSIRLNVMNILIIIMVLVLTLVVILVIKKTERK